MSSNRHGFSNEEHIANYLNNEYLTSEYIPKKMQTYLIEKEWVVGADAAVDYTGEQSEWSDTKKANNPAYTTKTAFRFERLFGSGDY